MTHVEAYLTVKGALTAHGYKTCFFDPFEKEFLCITLFDINDVAKALQQTGTLPISFSHGA